MLRPSAQDASISASTCGPQISSRIRHAQLNFFTSVATSRRVYCQTRWKTRKRSRMKGSSTARSLKIQTRMESSSETPTITPVVSMTILKVKRKKRPITKVIVTIPRKKKRASKLILKALHRRLKRIKPSELSRETRPKSTKIDFSHSLIRTTYARAF